MTTATVVLSGGAPNGALTAGALCGIYESERTFHTFYTSGAGAVFGLVTIAPAKTRTADEVLKATRRAGIHDNIYQFLPVGYKTFFKSGPFTFPIKKFAEKLHLDEGDDKRKNEFARFYNDWLDLVAAVITPTPVNPLSKGVCAPFPFADDHIDFDRVKTFRGRFYMNAFCIETGVMEEFDKHQITKDHFRAALAFPFVYPPAELDTKHYYEGSALDPLNLPNLARRIARGDIEGSSHTIVLIDVLGALEQALIRQPRHLIDAYGISIITPVVSLAQTKLEYFKYRYLPDLERTKNVELIELSFKIEKRRRDTLTDWSRSNLEELFDIGRDAGKEFCRVYGDKLPRRAPDSADPIDTDTAERQRPAESQ